MKYCIIKDRPEREPHWIFNPSTPLTEEALESFAQEAATLLLNRLSQLEAGRRTKP
jgi:hypothetical protein